MLSRTANARLRQAERSVAEAAAADRDSFTRWRDRQYFGPRRWLENALREPYSNNGGEGDNSRSTSSKAAQQGQAGTSSGTGPHSSQLNQSSPIWLSDEIEFWPDNSKRFTSIASMHSELIAIGTNGLIHQWKWTDVEPYRHHDVRMFCFA